MYSFGALAQAIPSAVPAMQLTYDASTLAFVAFVCFAASVGGALGLLRRAQRAETGSTTEVRGECCAPVSA